MLLALRARPNPPNQVQISMNKRATLLPSHRKSESIALGGDLSIDSLDRLIGSRKLETTSDRIELVMSEATWIEVDALLYLLAYLDYWHKASKDLHISLPSNPRQRNFLRRWGFFEGIADITGLSTTDYLNTQDTTQLDADIAEDPYPYFGISVNQDQRDEPRLSARFFAIQHIRPRSDLVEDADARILRQHAIREADRWKDRHVQAVLRRALKGDPTRVATHVVYELVANALWHPGATQILTVSEQPLDQSVLRLAVWDNGDAIPRTLRTALRRTGTINAHRVPHFRTFYNFTLERGASSGPTTVVDSDSFAITKKSSDLDFMLASLFPGVTSKPSRPTQGVATHSDLPGMGLFVASNTAVRDYGGTLTVRSANGMLRVTEGTASADRRRVFDVTGTVRPGNTFFPGNLLSIELPLAS